MVCEPITFLHEQQMLNGPAKIEGKGHCIKGNLNASLLWYMSQILSNYK